MYTDNPQGDCQILENSFQSSLVKDVVAVEPYGHLEGLEIPENVTIDVRNTEEGINKACGGIIRDVDGMGVDEHAVVGFDSEWNVEFMANGRFQHHGPTAVVQLAYRDIVYILQVRFISPCLSGGIH